MPASLATCGAALLAAAILLLQNYPRFADELEKTLYTHSLYTSAQKLPQVLRSLGAASGLHLLDCAERSIVETIKELMRKKAGHRRRWAPDGAYLRFTNYDLRFGKFARYARGMQSARRPRRGRTRSGRAGDWTKAQLLPVGR